MISRRNFIIASSFSAIFSVSMPFPGLAQTIAELDLRSLPVSAENNFYIIFSARQQSLVPEKLTKRQFSLGGHAYVALGRDDPTKLMSYVQTFGAHPVEDSKGKWSIIIGQIPGEVRKVFESDVSARLIIKVDEADYQRAENIISAWDKKGQYRLLWEDCTTMMNEVAKAVGLKVPDRGGTSPATWFPAGALEKLVGENPQSGFLNGTWDSSEPAKRFRLEIRGDQCSWTERSKSGKSLTVHTTVEKVDGEWRVVRPNDAETLAFSGARTTVISEILARSPPPSFMKLTRLDARTLNGRWSGLRWTLDKNNRLVDLVVPGSTSSDFVFAQATA